LTTRSHAPDTLTRVLATIPFAPRQEALLQWPACDGVARPVRVRHGPDRGDVIRTTKRQAAVVTLFILLAASLFTAAAHPSPVTSKESEAEQVLAQIQSIDSSLEKAVEAYNAANIRLDSIKAEQAVNERRLEIARSNFQKAQDLLQQRLVALYTSRDQSALEILLGSSSLDDLLDRVDTVNRVSEQDARIIGEVRTFRSEIKKREAELEKARVDQERVVADRAAQRESIQRQLSERQELLSSIRSDIERLKREEAARQQQLEADARNRIDSSPAPVSSGGGNPAGGHSGVVGIAMQYLGVPYRWGGASPSGFDCSGFTMYVYAQVGVSLPHNAAMQYSMGSAVSRESLQPGDLVFFNGLGHVGIYIGGNQMIHAPHTGDVVKISALTGWYSSTYVGARRY
jgi:cell wall-associated NlpC family hydrolase